MLKFFAVVVLICATASTNANPIVSNVRIIKALSVARNPIQEIQQLNKAENCGYSVVHDVRSEQCNSAPCTFSRGQTYTIEAEFTTRGEYMNPFFRAILVHRSEMQVIQDDLYLAPEIRLEANTRYIFSYDFKIPSDGFKGVDAELRFKVFQNMVAGLCIAIPTTLV